MFKRILHSMTIFLFLLVSLIGSPVSAAVPKPQGDIYVQDFANLLDDSEKQELIQLGRTLEDQTKAQIAVLTVNSLEDQTPEEYALEAFRTYELGDKELNNGVLLLIANKDRKARIEVGYGLEGALPDGKVGRILDTYTIPYMQSNQPNEAVINTYKELFNVVSQEYQLNESTDSKAYVSEVNNESGMATWKKLLIGAALVIFIIIDMTFFGGTFTYMLLHILSAFSRNGGGRGGGNRGGGGGSSGGGGASRGW